MTALGSHNHHTLPLQQHGAVTFHRRQSLICRCRLCLRVHASVVGKGSTPIKAACHPPAPPFWPFSVRKKLTAQEVRLSPGADVIGKGLAAAPRPESCPGLTFTDKLRVGWLRNPLVGLGEQMRSEVFRRAAKNSREGDPPSEASVKHKRKGEPPSEKYAVKYRREGTGSRARALRERFSDLREGKRRLKEQWKGESPQAQVNVHMDDGRKLVWNINRRDALRQITLGIVLGDGAAYGWLRPGKADAALLQFPATDLRNTYYLVRAGESEAEARDYVLTNPVSKTSMSSGLSRHGRDQVVKETLETLKSMGACSEGCWLWPSITQRSYQTAELLSSLLGVSQSRIVPEYSFLDPRGMGALEGLRIEAAMHQVQEGDSFSPDWRPLRGYDGTPNESVADVLVRVRQVLSITETQYSGNDIIIISPDSDNLSILQAALLGADLRRHHDFSFRPGEVRAVQLSTEPGDYSPRSYSCPRPPRCV